MKMMVNKKARNSLKLLRLDSLQLAETLRFGFYLRRERGRERRGRRVTWKKKRMNRRRRKSGRGGKEHTAFCSSIQ